MKAGESLAIVGGGGGLGHLGVQFAKALGLYVIAIDARDEALELAKKCGADTIVDARHGKEKVVEEVHKVTGRLGADATINVSDDVNAASASVAVTRMHGLMVQIAQPPDVSVPFAELVFRDVRIHGSLISKYCQKLSRNLSQRGQVHEANARKCLIWSQNTISRLKRIHSMV